MGNPISIRIRYKFSTNTVEIVQFIGVVVGGRYDSFFTENEN